VLIFLPDRRLVSLGAVITILVLAFDTFTQQVLTTEFKSVVISKDAEAPLQLPRSEYLSVSERVFSGKSKSCYLILPPELDTPTEVNICASKGSGPDWGTISAAYNGFFSNNTSPIPVSCPPGNCTWPLTPSLGVCSSCKPISWNTTCALVNEPTGQICNYTLPDGNVVIIDGVDGTTEATLFQILPSSIHGPPDSNTVFYIHIFDAIGMPFNSLGWSNSEVSAQQCAFWFCIQTYNVTVVNNIQKYIVVETWGETEHDNYTNDWNFTSIPRSMNTDPNTNYTVRSTSCSKIFPFYLFHNQNAPQASLVPNKPFRSS
jgi:hypothetical protein